MPVPEAQIEIPEIEVLDTPFKKLIACSAALLVLFGSLLAVAASRASEHEQSLSAQAQKASITALANYGAAYAEISRLAGSDAEARSLLQRAELARDASTLTGLGTYTTAAQGWEQSSLGLTDLMVKETGAAHYDDVNRAATELLVQPRIDTLQADADRETATAWGAKADRYILGITLLAVALSLLGLSLTLAEGTRKLVVFPAVVIAGGAVLVSVGALAQRASATPPGAVRALAEGDKQMSLRQFDAAIKSYSKAIELRDDYPQAYRARSTAYLGAGSSESGAYFITMVDERSRKLSIDDLDRALELSPVPDYITLVNQGANLFHTGEYAKSEKLTSRALASNDALPLPLANLGLVQAAQGKADDARKSYTKMINLVGSRPDPVEQRELYASSRTTLEILATKKPDLKGLVQELEGMLVAAQAKQLHPGPNPAGADAKISALKLTANGSYVEATYQEANLPAQSRVSWIAYFRRSGDEPWQQPANLVAFAPDSGTQPGRRTLVDVGCRGRGEYRLDAWLDDRLIATATTTATTFSSLETPYVGSYDPGGGNWACRPVGWDLEDKVPGRVQLTALASGRDTLTVRTAPLPAELLDQARPSVVNTALDTEPRCVAAGKPTLQTPHRISGVDGAYRWYREQKDGRYVFCWAGVGADNSLRVVVAQYGKASSALIADLLKRLYFEIRQP